MNDSIMDLGCCIASKPLEGIQYPQLYIREHWKSLINTKINSILPRRDRKSVQKISEGNLIPTENKHAKEDRGIDKHKEDDNAFGLHWVYRTDGLSKTKH